MSNYSSRCPLYAPEVWQSQTYSPCRGVHTCDATSKLQPGAVEMESVPSKWAERWRRYRWVHTGEPNATECKVVRSRRKEKSLWHKVHQCEPAAQNCPASGRLPPRPRRTQKVYAKFRMKYIPSVWCIPATKTYPVRELPHRQAFVTGTLCVVVRAWRVFHFKPQINFSFPVRNTI